MSLNGCLTYTSLPFPDTLRRWNSHDGEKPQVTTAALGSEANSRRSRFWRKGGRVQALFLPHENHCLLSTKDEGARIVLHTGRCILSITNTKSIKILRLLMFVAPKLGEMSPPGISHCENPGKGRTLPERNARRKMTPLSKGQPKA